MEGKWQPPPIRHTYGYFVVALAGSRMLPAKPTAQNIAASMPADKPVASGRAIINMPIKPIKIDRNLVLVKVSFKNKGAIRATHKGAVNSNAKS